MELNNVSTTSFKVVYPLRSRKNKICGQQIQSKKKLNLFKINKAFLLLTFLFLKINFVDFDLFLFYWVFGECNSSYLRCIQDLILISNMEPFATRFISDVAICPGYGSTLHFQKSIITFNENKITFETL